jgi:hypothetical protein
LKVGPASSLLAMPWSRDAAATARACATYKEFRGEMTVRLDPDSERGMRVLVPPIARSAISPARHSDIPTASGLLRTGKRPGGNSVSVRRRQHCDTDGTACSLESTLSSRHRLLLGGYFAFGGWKLLCVCRGHFAHPLPRRLRACQRTGMSVRGARGQKQPHMHRRCSVLHLHPVMPRRAAERPVPGTACHIQTCGGVPGAITDAYARRPLLNEQCEGRCVRSRSA